MEAATCFRRPCLRPHSASHDYRGPCKWTASLIAGPDDPNTHDGTMARIRVSRPAPWPLPFGRGWTAGRFDMQWPMSWNS